MRVTPPAGAGFATIDPAIITTELDARGVFHPMGPVSRAVWYTRSQTAQLYVLIVRRDRERSPA